jgi:23S rRNA (adenine2503-C2)-methyltransferase
MKAARAFSDQTGRIVTIEYCLLAGVNDSDEQAGMLADLLEGFRAHVNLIPCNSIGPGLSGQVYLRPSAARMQRFLELLRNRRVVAHLRRTRGDDVDAACGQLRARVAISGDLRKNVEMLRSTSA